MQEESAEAETVQTDLPLPTVETTEKEGWLIKKNQRYQSCKAKESLRGILR